jgi:hypothetical protein
MFGGNFIKFEIEPPNKRASYKLTFDTDCNQITICFDNYHCHYDNFENLDFIGEMKKSMDTITRIIADELLVVSYYSEGKLHMSSLEERSFLDHFEQKPIELGNKKIDSISVVSWSGEYDNERNVDQISTDNSTLIKAERAWWQKLFSSE